MSLREMTYANHPFIVMGRRLFQFPRAKSKTLPQLSFGESWVCVWNVGSTLDKNSASILKLIKTKNVTFVLPHSTEQQTKSVGYATRGNTCAHRLLHLPISDLRVTKVCCIPVCNTTTTHRKISMEILFFSPEKKVGKWHVFSSEKRRHNDRPIKPFCAVGFLKSVSADVLFKVVGGENVCFLLWDSKDN